MTTYSTFLENKQIRSNPSGFTISPDSLNPHLFDFQKVIVQWAIARGKAALFADCGLGKALRNGTKVLTINGWQPIECLRVGDKIFGSDGFPYPIKGVYPQGTRQLYRVTFSDGITIDCDGDHLWTVKTMNDRQRGTSRTITTHQIIADGLTVGKKKYPPYRYSIPMVAPIKSPFVELPLDPYLLGVLIGDGGLSNGQVMLTTDNEIASQLILPNNAYIKKRECLSCEYVSTYSINSSAKSAGNQRSNPVRMALIDLGLHKSLSDTKFIPAIYLNASVEQRWALLQGLLDTDGYCGNQVKKGTSQPCTVTIEYSTSSAKLASDVISLVQSLGGTATLGIKTNASYVDKQGVRIQCKTAYRIVIKTPTSLGCPFRLSRKASKYNPSKQRPEPYRIIRNIKQIDTDYATCISVDSPDHLFVTEGYVLTHNTVMQIEWANHVCNHTQGKVLILAPLAVATQTVKEGEKFGIKVNHCLDQTDVADGINITNYERIHRFSPEEFTGIILDESSILKGFDGKLRKLITDFGSTIPYRLSATATPSPNDLIELATQAEFLGVMSIKETKAVFFKQAQDGETVHQWRLKGHAKDSFYDWLASWAIAIRKPSDIGFSDNGFVLPALNYHQTTVKTNTDNLSTLFAMEAKTLQERRQARRNSMSDRVKLAAELVNNSSEAWIVWCDLNAESQSLTQAIADAKEITGSDSPEKKEQLMQDFTDSKIRVIVTKPPITGFGLNWQHCRNMVFVGLSDSFEQQYQAIRRCWRFGQTREVNVHFVTSDLEGAVVRNVQRKERESTEMMNQLVSHMKAKTMEQLSQATTRDEMTYQESVASGDDWTLYLGDCCDRIKEIESDSVGLTIFSPPFPGMYVYSNSVRDIGNNKNTTAMMDHFEFLIPELLRVSMPGRSCCIHLTQEPVFKGADGYIGLRDFRGEVIRRMEANGWIYYGEVCIDKNPQIKAARTKEQSLLFKTLSQDSSRSRMAMADYLLQFVKPGENPKPIEAGTHKRWNPNGGWITPDEWCRWARPVWYAADWAPDGDGIKETDVLRVDGARESEDERHLCPLQLGVIERAVKLWSAPDDLIFSPFAGIGSEGVRSIELNRKFVGIELKKSYWATAAKNLKQASFSKSSQLNLFNLA